MLTISPGLPNVLPQSRKCLEAFWFYNSHYFYPGEQNLTSVLKKLMTDVLKSVPAAVFGSSDFTSSWARSTEAKELTSAKSCWGGMGWLSSIPSCMKREQSTLSSSLVRFPGEKTLEVIYLPLASCRCLSHSSNSIHISSTYISRTIGHWCKLGLIYAAFAAGHGEHCSKPRQTTHARGQVAYGTENKPPLLFNAAEFWITSNMLLLFWTQNSLCHITPRTGSSLYSEFFFLKKKNRTHVFRGVWFLYWFTPSSRLNINRSIHLNSYNVFQGRVCRNFQHFKPNDLRRFSKMWFMLLLELIKNLRKEVFESELEDNLKKGTGKSHPFFLQLLFWISNPAYPEYEGICDFWYILPTQIGMKNYSVYSVQIQEVQLCLERTMLYLFPYSILRQGAFFSHTQDGS